MSPDTTPQVLRPYSAQEGVSPAEAARIAGMAVPTIRHWCSLHHIGRRVGGQWRVSRVALHMLLDGDRAALSAYLAGDRTSPAVVAYFQRLGITPVAGEVAHV